MSSIKYIVSKTELINGSVISNAVGYITSEADANTLNAAFDSSYLAFIRTNKDALRDGSMNIAEYFNSNPPIHDDCLKTTSVDGMNLPIINNINTL